MNMLQRWQWINASPLSISVRQLVVMAAISGSFHAIDPESVQVIYRALPQLITKKDVFYFIQAVILLGLGDLPTCIRVARKSDLEEAMQFLKMLDP